MTYVHEVHDVTGIGAYPPSLDLENLDEVVLGIVHVNSMLSLVWALGYPQYSEELITLLREYVGRFVEVLGVEGSYVQGMAFLLASRISRNLWELDLSDEELGEFLSLLVSYRISLIENGLGVEDARELVRLTCLYLQIPRCEEVEAYLKPLTPLTALQMALTGLAVSVGGIGV